MIASLTDRTNTNHVTPSEKERKRGRDREDRPSPVVTLGQVSSTPPLFYFFLGAWFQNDGLSYIKDI